MGGVVVDTDALLSSSPSLIWLQLGFGLAGAVTIVFFSVLVQASPLALSLAVEMLALQWRQHMGKYALLPRGSQRCPGPGGGLNTHPTGKQRTREPKQLS